VDLETDGEEKRAIQKNTQEIADEAFTNHQLKEKKRIYNKKYYIKHREQIRRYKKRWREENIERIKERDKKWYITNRQKRLEYNRKYYKTHLQEWSERNRLYRETHSQQVLKYNKQYRKNNPEKIKKAIKDWRKNNIGKVKEMAKKQRDRRRNLRFKPLNKYFKNSESHHLDENYVVYIPKEIHQSIRHCLERNKNVDEINKLALDFVVSELEREFLCKQK